MVYYGRIRWALVPGRDISRDELILNVDIMNAEEREVVNRIAGNCKSIVSDKSLLGQKLGKRVSWKGKNEYRQLMRMQNQHHVVKIQTSRNVICLVM